MKYLRLLCPWASTKRWSKGWKFPSRQEIIGRPGAAGQELNAPNAISGWFEYRIGEKKKGNTFHLWRITIVQITNNGSSLAMRSRVDVPDLVLDDSYEFSTPRPYAVAFILDTNPYAS